MRGSVTVTQTLYITPGVLSQHLPNKNSTVKIVLIEEIQSTSAFNQCKSDVPSTLVTGHKESGLNQLPLRRSGEVFSVVGIGLSFHKRVYRVLSPPRTGDPPDQFGPHCIGTSSRHVQTCSL